MLVYRSGSRERSGAELKAQLFKAVSRLASNCSRDCITEALLCAAEIECALADVQLPTAADLAQISDALAAALVHGQGQARFEREVCLTLQAQLTRLELPERLNLRVPEGYAYYALDPLVYASMTAQLEASARRLAVIGVRSIGTSLGAVVAAAARHQGRDAERISVRPEGSPWARSLHWSSAERAFVERQKAHAALFVVVDEGPGLSGSTLLSVTEALEQSGVAAARIVLFGSHSPDPAKLVAHEARRRWQRYRSYAPDTDTHTDTSAPSLDLSAGAWRKHVFGADTGHWPASWTQLERVKRLSHDGRWIDKFEGLGPYGEAALTRARSLADAGLGPDLTAAHSGFARFAWIAGRPACSADVGPQSLEALAQYCAFRTRAFAVRAADAGPLREMLRVNVEEAFGCDLGDRLPLEITTPIVPDARMQLYEWCVRADGRLYKIDGHGDGDGHLLPGPADVCWDLAGAIIEWNMDTAQQAAFVRRFEQLSGEPAAQRLDHYLAAYCALRMGELTMALLSANAEEGARLRAACVTYTTRLEHWLNTHQLRFTRSSGVYVQDAHVVRR
jgi:hypothetical protein